MSKPRLPLLMIAAILCAGLVAQPVGAQSTSPITDPIPEDPIPAGLGLVVEEFATFPKSEPHPAPVDSRLMRHARINYIGEVPDGSGRLYVPDLNGTMYLVKDRTPHAYLDVRAQFPDFFSGRGLGSGFGFVAFHPAYADNGRFYTVHSEQFAALETKTPDLTAQVPTFLHAVVTEWTADDPAADTFAGTSREVIRLAFGTQIHAIQQIDFNPNAEPGDEDYGLLYLAVGDGGRGWNTDQPQDLAVPHGKLVRIDPAGRDSANGKYGIPATNPFVGKPGALGEIYAVGMRDPHRFSWDTGANQRMFLGHIGEHEIEAVYDVRAGDNYGWSEREGAFVFTEQDRCNLYPLPANDDEFGFTYPVAAFDHDPPPGWPCTRDSGHAISGGFVYRGSNVPTLQGKYLFADLVDGRIFYTNAGDMDRDAEHDLATTYQLKVFDAAGSRVSMQDLAGDERVDLRFGRDRAGELYLLAKANGKVWKVIGTRRTPRNPDVHPSLQRDLAAFYDFEHPFVPQPSVEVDQGFSGTNINLINGGADMRVADGAYAGSNRALQTQQVNPTQAGNDDWKAGVYSADGVPTLRAFNAVQGTTIMGWFKMTGQNPSPNSNSANPDDFFGAIGLAGVLSGDSDGHAVRALLELIRVNGEMRLVALGRRIDGGRSQTFAASADWQTLLPQGEWVFLAATFDFNTGEMALYRNGERLDGFYAVAGDPWEIAGPGPHVTSATDPRGIKIGGSFPQNTRETNPCNCRMDNLMFLDRVVVLDEVASQYRHVTGRS